MTNKTEQLEQTIEELQAALQKAQKDLEQAKQQEDKLAPRPFPECDGSWFYYTENFHLGVDSAKEWATDNRNDRHRWEKGTVFKQRRHAETLALLQLKWGQFTAKAIELADGYEPDWKSDEGKYFVEYYHGDGGFSVSSYASFQQPGTIYLPTSKLAQELADWANANVDMT